jgi:hypothetical protein
MTVFYFYSGKVANYYVHRPTRVGCSVFFRCWPRALRRLARDRSQSDE